jgi:hypothetical protein
VPRPFGLAPLLCALGLLLAAVPARGQDAVVVAARGQEEPAAGARPGLLSFGADITFTTTYVWRGFVLGEDPALQPSVWVNIGPLTIASWSNADLPSGGSALYSEHDLSVDYSTEVRGLAVSVGWTHYAFVRETEGRYSNDIHLSIGAGGYLNPTVEVSQDVHQGSGTYVAAGVSHDYPLWGGPIRLTPTVSIGYNHRLWTERSGLSDVTATLAFAVPLPGSRLALEPFLTYSCGLHAEVFPRRFLGGVVLRAE